MDYHKPVMLFESVEGLAIKPDGVYVDCTFGGGGHSREILRRLTTGKLIAFDQDSDAAANIPEGDKFLFANANFRFLVHFIRFFGYNQVDGILADLGVSSHHFDAPERGFSFRFEGKLDMRMNRQSGQTAAELISAYEEADLVRIFRDYGEIPEARRLAAAIVKARQTSRVETVEDLLTILAPLVPKKEENKFLARVFQAVRMEVNNELGSLEDLLVQIPDCLSKGGRMVFITYHSLEDRLVKNFIKNGKTEGEVQKDLYGNVQVPLKAINKKVIVPGEQEMLENSRSRSAKLRIAERI